MVEVVDNKTGEVREVERIEEALDMVERPPYWRRMGHAYASATVDEGEWDKEFDESFLKVQETIGPLIWAESENQFNKYASLGGLLAKIQPILVKYQFKLNQGAGKVNIRNDIGGKAFLPIWTRVTHVPTGQWQRVWVEMPMIKFDPQAYGTLMTYGRRYALVAYFGLASTDDDGLLASTKPILDLEEVDRETAALSREIGKCASEADLRGWHKRAESQLAGLTEEAMGRIKEIWQKRLQEVKNTDVPQEKKVRKNAQGS